MTSTRLLDGCRATTSPKLPSTKPQILIFADPWINVVGLFTLADTGPLQIQQALATANKSWRKNCSEPTFTTEFQRVREIAVNDRFLAVNGPYIASRLYAAALPDASSGPGSSPSPPPL